MIGIYLDKAHTITNEWDKYKYKSNEIQIQKLGTNAFLLNGGQRLIRITCEGTNRKTFPILTFVQNSVKEQIIFGEKGNYKAANFIKRHKTITLQLRFKRPTSSEKGFAHVDRKKAPEMLVAAQISEQNATPAMQYAGCRVQDAG